MTAITAVDSTIALVPGPVNAHSHAFHRVLRGRTHREQGSFWTWREQMYSAASALTPAGYERLATAVFAEMVVSGWTAVGEFHYVHHRPDGTPYADHDMERALARAAAAAGIRLVLLDTCYLAGGIGQPLAAAQTRFSDGDAAAWVRRVHSLRAALAEEAGALVTVGTAIHSVRAVPADQLTVIASDLDPALPLHVHLSEQQAENVACLDAHGVTPTELLERSGLLSPRLSAVHATHLTDADIALLGRREVTIVMCPTTEADLGDGIGPARALHDAGATIALGSDQHAVLDPFLEMRGLEHHERLGAQLRGRFTPAEIISAAVDGGRRSLGLGLSDDVLLVRRNTARTAGSDLDQLPLTATAADIAEVRIAGTVVARDGEHTSLGDPGRLYADALTRLDL
ncbi:formimidoylglutamate deiminase [Microbacterium sp. cx-59]|uniref:formimidoylglutamate deiminase n=1 Tax=Microbacterium sp. cx-59 TaxID=2891207 RepID=UPI001E610991|nr:formimidoylglutamate deiminase [Microbacterium sp. cx-59]MCC4908745.1 formimidoylglutamate deiminase [Microbacterium sp. cx-59]